MITKVVPVQNWPAGRVYIMLPLSIHVFFSFSLYSSFLLTQEKNQINGSSIFNLEITSRHYCFFNLCDFKTNKAWTAKLKAQPANAFFATVNQMFGGSSQLPTTAQRVLIKSLSTIQATEQCSVVVGSWGEPQNIWLTVTKNAFVGWALILVAVKWTKKYNLIESKLAKMSQVFAHGIALSSSNSTATTMLDRNIKLEAVGTKAASRCLKAIKLSADEFWSLKMRSTTNLGKTTLKDGLNKHGLNHWSSIPHKSAISPLSKLG